LACPAKPKKEKLLLKSRTRFREENLYSQITNLPFSEDPDCYMKSFNKLKNSSMINEPLKTYLKERHKTKELWVKSYFKVSFTCGSGQSKVMGMFLNKRKVVPLSQLL